MTGLLTACIRTGGTPDTEKEFLASLLSNPRRQMDRYTKRTPPVANQFALGYTYQDVLDAEHEGMLDVVFECNMQLTTLLDTLARLSFYLLSEPSASFAALLKPLLIPQSLPDCLVVILLDWTHPWSWLRELKAWILLLRELLVSLSDDAKEVMEEIMLDWRENRKGGGVTSDGSGGLLGLKENVSIPLGPGEWDEALGVPVCVVCQNVGGKEIPVRFFEGRKDS